MSIENLENLLDMINFTYEELEMQISRYKLCFSDYRNDKIEWEEKLPLFVPSFYNYIKKYGCVPAQENYYEFYFLENNDKIKSKKFTSEEIEGIKARIYRTYPSLVRDLHFGLFLKDKKYFNSVFYNVILDIEYGVDLAVTTNEGIKLGFNLFTKTKAAEYARSVKVYRPKKSVGFACYEIPLDLKNCKKCGDFFLYSEKEALAIIDAVKSHMNSVL